VVTKQLSILLIISFNMIERSISRLMGALLKKKKLNKKTIYILYIKINEKLVDVFTTRDIHKGECC
jgi:hypothetical protein